MEPNPVTTLLTDTQKVAKKHYDQPLLVWCAMLGRSKWKAYLINSENKVVVTCGPFCKNQEKALSALKAKLNKKAS